MERTSKPHDPVIAKLPEPETAPKTIGYSASDSTIASGSSSDSDTSSSSSTGTVPHVLSNLELASAAAADSSGSSKTSSPLGNNSAAVPAEDGSHGLWQLFRVLGDGLSSLASLPALAVSTVSDLFKQDPKVVLTNHIKDALKLNPDQELPVQYQPLVNSLAETPEKTQAFADWLEAPVKSSSRLQSAGLDAPLLTALSHLHSRIERPAEYAATQLQRLYGMDLPEPVKSFIKYSPHELSQFTDKLLELFQGNATPEEIQNHLGLIEHPDGEVIKFFDRLRERLRTKLTQTNTDGLGYNFVPQFMPHNVMTRFQLSISDNVYSTRFNELPRSIRDFSTEHFKNIEMYWQPFTKPIPDYAAGWMVSSVPSNTTAGLMKGQRVLAMADILPDMEPRARFGTVEFDFSELGELNLDQAKAIMQAVHARASNFSESEEAIAKQKSDLLAFFSQEQVEQISPKLTQFLRDCEAKYEQIHGELFRYRGSKENQSMPLRIVD
jgi:hypothetical protein